MTLPPSWSHPPAARESSRSGLGKPDRAADTGFEEPVMLTISIIFALLVLLWGRIGVAHVER